MKKITNAQYATMVVILTAIGALALFFLSHSVIIRIITLGMIGTAIYYFYVFEKEFFWKSGACARRAISAVMAQTRYIKRIIPFFQRLKYFLQRACIFIVKEKNKIISYVFLFALACIVYCSFDALPFVAGLKKYQTALLVISIISGIATFLPKRAQTENSSKENEGIAEQKQTRGKLQIHNLPILRNIMRWKQKEGSTYATIIIVIFITGLFLHASVANWSKDYTYFHSGESQFYNLIKEYSFKNTAVMYQRSQSIVIYTFGTIDELFNNSLSIYDIRLIISLLTYGINFFILLNLREVELLHITKRASIYILLGFTLSYGILFYSSLIRSDIFILTFFNLFLYEYLKNGTRNLLYLITLCALAVSFKGNGLLLTIVLFTLLNYENVKDAWLKHHWSIHRLLKDNFITATLFGLLFLLFNPLYVKKGILDFSATFKSGIEKFGSGHYGLFATGQDFFPMYIERFTQFLYYFSPLILLYFIGTITYCFKKLKKEGLKKIFFSQEGRVFAVLGLSFIFFLFIFEKPIQFYRYYFPLITVLLVVTFIVIAKIKYHFLNTLLLVLFIGYNAYFIYHIQNNSRFNFDFSKVTPLYRQADTRPWMYPPTAKFIGTIDTMDEIPTKSYLLVPEQSKYIYDRILQNPKKYRNEDYFGLEEGELERALVFYSELDKLTPVNPPRKNTFLGMYLPYDTWYMNSPNYYLYQKE
jgi:hypothetical protein